MADSTAVNILAKKMREKGKGKQFRWDSAMVENLITCLQSFKSQMEYKNVDFDGDRPAQYSWLRLEMSNLYEVEDTSLFGPVSVTLPIIPLSDMSKEEKEDYTKRSKAENDLIKKGYSRIREKVKEIRQSFSQAVINGRRSGSGKIVFEFYDKLVTIWGGSASTQPLPYGVDTDTFVVEEDQEDSTLMNQEDCSLTQQSNVSEVTTTAERDTVELDMPVEDSDGERVTDSRKRKCVNQVPNLIDNKRKHLEKALSAAQRDKLLLTEAKEDSVIRKSLAEATRQSTECFTTALKDVSNSMMQVGNGISRSMEMMSQAIMAQIMTNSQPRPYNQNLFYQNNPGAYPSNVAHPAHGTHPAQGTYPAHGVYPNPAQYTVPHSDVPRFEPSLDGEDNVLYHPM